ncbi:Ribosome maturation factor RimP [Candidatus Profftia lariciata]|uniref:ribosome maturation factor RimP n=1 Tax=Candidatus Profftia lariciata TaxID=1987921 RepID=UPI001D010A96|nr:ribosome maturation factor RimP [Candidatus Profftia lariciata]UDG81529.1 Ribosome maturation factor RimP [Candidatus Profftia lariciata]
MSKLKQTLIKIISEPVNVLGFELLGLELIYNHCLTLRIYIDNDKGITINDCANVSYRISVALDAKNIIQVAYNLEVSSPGVYRPIFKIEHYVRFIGENILIILRKEIQHRNKWQGIIKDAKNKRITVTIDKKDEIFLLSNIQKAHLVPTLLKFESGY